jgi:hypothetical protein
MNKSKQNIAAVIIFFVNLLFAYKYSIRVSVEFGIVFTAVYACVLSFLYFVRDKILVKPIIFFSAFFTYILLLGIALFFIDKLSLNVDRWEMIDMYFSNVSKGIDPYSVSSPSGNYPAALPFYFIIFAPFYFLGETAIATLLILASVCIYYFKQKNTHHQIFALISLSSVAFVWEILSRSTIIVNAYLILFILLHVSNIEKFNSLNFIISGIILGLLLSSRTVFAFVFVIWGIYELKQKYSFGKLFLFCAIALLTFAATLLPFALIWSNTFFDNNPFTIQSTLLHNFLLPITVIMALILGLICRKKVDVIFYSGIFLMAIPLLEFIITIIQINITDALINSKFDISYLLICFPFLIHAIAISDKKVRL